MKKRKLEEQKILLSSLLAFALDEIFFIPRVKQRHIDFLLCFLSGMKNKEAAFVMKTPERAAHNSWAFLMSKKRKKYKDKLYTKLDLLRICLYEVKGIELDKMLSLKIKKTLPKQNDILILPRGAQ